MSCHFFYIQLDRHFFTSKNGAGSQNATLCFIGVLESTCRHCFCGGHILVLTSLMNKEAIDTRAMVARMRRTSYPNDSGNALALVMAQSGRDALAHNDHIWFSGDVMSWSPDDSGTALALMTRYSNVAFSTNDHIWMKDCHRTAATEMDETLRCVFGMFLDYSDGEQWTVRPLM